MKHTSPVIALIALFLFGCGDSEEQPSTKDYQKQFAVQIPAFIELSSFDVEASENVGSKVEPLYKARFKATVKLKTKTFEIARQENGVIFIRPVADVGETKEIYGRAEAHLSAGNWIMSFRQENDPIPAMGRPRDFFTGGNVIVVGTAEESEYKTQQDQKRAAAEVEAEKALRARQAEEARVAAEREQQRMIAEKEAKAADDRYQARHAEEVRQATERERMRFKVVEAAYFTANHSVDVTRELNSLIRNDHLNTFATNDLAGDPDGGVVKSLRIKYQFKGEFYFKLYKEGEQIQLP
jgi:hypothetical protein